MAKPVAGRGSNIDPKKPENRNASSYMPEENVNEGPRGGKKASGKPVGFHGQTSDASGEKNELIPLRPMQFDPYKTRGEDFPVKEVNEWHGQDEAGAATWENPNGGGKNDLVSWGGNLCSPRNVEDDGMGSSGAGTPVPGNRGERVRAAFPISVNDGESESDTGEISIPESVNLQTGYLEVSGVDVTPVDVTPDRQLTIGSSTSKAPKSMKR
jgi:hypothetical protein